MVTVKACDYLSTINRDYNLLKQLVVQNGYKEVRVPMMQLEDIVVHAEFDNANMEIVYTFKPLNEVNE